MIRWPRFAALLVTVAVPHHDRVRAQSAARAAPRVALVRPAEARQSDDLGGGMRLWLHDAHRGRVLLQGQVRPVVAVGRGEAGQKALQGALVEDDDVICPGVMPRWRIAVRTSRPSLASRSRIRERGAWSQGKASRSRGVIQAGVGWVVTRKDISSRRCPRGGWRGRCAIVAVGRDGPGAGAGCGKRCARRRRGRA